MKLEIYNVIDKGDAKGEYLILQVTDDCNLSRYMILDNTYDADGNLSNKLRHTFIFPDKNVKKGEIVYLFTKPGNYKRGKSNDGTTAHYFYWGLGQSVWNDDGDTIHLIEISNTSSKPITSN